jgi:hypothetical protein
MTTFRLQLRWLLAICALLVIPAFVPLATLAYDAEHGTSIDYDGSEKSSPAYDVASSYAQPSSERRFAEKRPSFALFGRLLAAKETTTVIGRVKDLQKLGPGEKSLLDRLPNLGSPKANWKQNSGVLRQEMNRGLPIRDASIGDNTGPFLNAERNLLQDRGWKLDGGYWNPPN